VLAPADRTPGGLDTMTDQERIEAIKARLEATTPGPWRPCLGSGIHMLSGVSAEREERSVAICDMRPDWEPRETMRQDHRPDMVFIAHAPDDVRFLLGLLGPQAEPADEGPCDCDECVTERNRVI
jgi:hypothetical protein